MTRTEVFCDRCSKKLNNFREFTPNNNEYHIYVTHPDKGNKINPEYVLCKDCYEDLISFISGQTSFEFTKLNSEVEIYRDWLKTKDPDEPEVW